MTKLHTADLVVGYEKKIVIKDVTIEIPDGKITSLIGPNGSGKTTLLKAMARILIPKSGTVFVDGEDVQRQDSKQVAQKIASLSQNSQAVNGLKVAEIVAYGRFPYQKGFSSLKQMDHELIRWALDACNITHLKDRPIASLSGGQQQRVWIAMALAQDTDILILDEPITFLDPAHQLEILELLETINQQGKTILMTIHDLNHASRFSDHILGMKEGILTFQGTPKEIFTPENLAQLFDIQATIIESTENRKPIVVSYNLKKEA
ncbi:MULTISPECIES: ABC transporter ATP-binding protein [Enterococcus]|uniref:ABC transporter ATP-binding protein n=1 Tax=Enterococcus alishanensis TaxID=1303817 RepID=A0ABS6TAK7_9ENTE|nr:ABC transporter ATP-binding protein [Enterococcus alishanensis]MBV7389933.1 ABC transporter ATP-binding protein [Enterococcus alishanensis]